MVNSEPLNDAVRQTSRLRVKGNITKVRSLISDAFRLRLLLAATLEPQYPNPEEPDSDPGRHR